MKKNSFIEGTVIATIFIVLVKILGMVYVVPFYSIVGSQGAALYGFGIHGFDKLAKDAGARRKNGKKVLINTLKLDDYIETMFAE